MQWHNERSKHPPLSLSCNNWLYNTSLNAETGHSLFTMSWVSKTTARVRAAFAKSRLFISGSQDVTKATAFADLCLKESVFELA